MATSFRALGQGGGDAELELELRRQGVGVGVERRQAQPDAACHQGRDAGQHRHQAQQQAAAGQRPEALAQHRPRGADHAQQSADRADGEEGEHAAPTLEVAHAAQAGDPQRHDAGDEPADDGADDAGEEGAEVDHRCASNGGGAGPHQAGAKARPPSILSTAPVV